VCRDRVSCGITLQPRDMIRGLCAGIVFVFHFPSSLLSLAKERFGLRCSCEQIVLLHWTCVKFRPGLNPFGCFCPRCVLCAALAAGLTIGLMVSR
jgi:hypothetical protein